MKKKRELKPKKVLWEMFLYTALALGAVTSLLSFLWVLSGSLESNNELFTWPIQWISANLRFQNLKDVLTQIPFVTYFLNVLRLSVINTLLQITICSLVVYTLSKIEFPGRNKLSLACLGTMMVPFHVTMIPRYMTISQLKLTDTHLVLILIQTFSPFGVFLLRQSFAGIPGELPEAVRVDGCSEPMILSWIMLPLVKGALTILTTFTFTFVWSDYLGPMIYPHKDPIRTIRIGLRMS